jgi:hypothetical protein
VVKDTNQEFPWWMLEKQGLPSFLLAVKKVTRLADED